VAHKRRKKETQKRRPSPPSLFQSGFATYEPVFELGGWFFWEAYWYLSYNQVQAVKIKSHIPLYAYRIGKIMKDVQYEHG
jgi:hypothetical protein